MNKKVLLIGHCGPDSSYLRLAVRSAVPEAEVTATCDAEGLDRHLQGMDLVLVNRVLDGLFDEENGIALIRRLKKEHAGAKFMLVSNYAEAQNAAVAVGALTGFGKKDIGTAAARTLIKTALE